MPGAAGCRTRPRPVRAGGRDGGTEGGIEGEREGWREAAAPRPPGTAGCGFSVEAGDGNEGSRAAAAAAPPTSTAGVQSAFVSAVSNILSE